MDRFATVAAFLRSQAALALATIGPDKEPCVAPLFYVVEEGLRLCWFSSRSSRHSRNLRNEAEASVAVYAPAGGWRDIRGVQMRGRVSLVKDRARRRSVCREYTARFQLDPSFDAVIARSGLYAFEPSWVRYIDNSRRFGYKFELLAQKPGGGY